MDLIGNAQLQLNSFAHLRVASNLLMKSDAKFQNKLNALFNDLELVASPSVRNLANYAHALGKRINTLLTSGAQTSAEDCEKIKRELLVFKNFIDNSLPNLGDPIANPNEKEKQYRVVYSYDNNYYIYDLGHLSMVSIDSNACHVTDLFSDKLPSNCPLKVTYCDGSTAERDSSGTWTRPAGEEISVHQIENHTIELGKGNYLTDSAKIVTFRIDRKGDAIVKVVNSDFSPARYAEFVGQVSFYPFSNTLDFHFEKPCELKIWNNQAELHTFKTPNTNDVRQKAIEEIKKAGTDNIPALLKFIAVASTDASPHFSEEGLTQAISELGISDPRALLEKARDLGVSLSQFDPMRDDDGKISYILPRLRTIRAITARYFVNKGVFKQDSGKIIFRPKDAKEVYLFNPENESVSIADATEVIGQNGAILREFIDRPWNCKNTLEVRCYNFSMQRNESEVSLALNAGSSIDVSNLITRLGHNSSRVPVISTSNFHALSGSWNPNTNEMTLHLIDTTLGYTELLFQGKAEIVSEWKGVHLTNIQSGLVTLKRGPTKEPLAVQIIR
jgi:hypothetical protein